MTKLSILIAIDKCKMSRFQLNSKKLLKTDKHKALIDVQSKL